MHGEYLLINGGKMSKSLGNVYLVKDIIEKGYDPLVYRLFSFSSHYKNKLNFTWEGMEATAKSLERLKNGYQLHLAGKDEVADNLVEALEEKFHQAINDDLNMPLAMSVVWEVVRQEQKSPKLAELLAKFDTVLGLKITEVLEPKTEEIPPEILGLVEQRKQARENKDWKKSDELRDKIKELGYIIKDTVNGIEVEKL